MNSGFFCHPCKRSLASLKALVRHNNKRQCVANAAVEISNTNNADQDATASVPTSLTNEAPVASINDVPPSAQSIASEPAPSNISSPMAAPSPMSKDIELQACIICPFFQKLYLHLDD